MIVGRQQPGGLSEQFEYARTTGLVFMNRFEPKAGVGAEPVNEVARELPALHVLVERR